MSAKHLPCVFQIKIETKHNSYSFHRNASPQCQLNSATKPDLLLRSNAMMPAFLNIDNSH